VTEFRIFKDWTILNQLQSIAPENSWHFSTFGLTYPAKHNPMSLKNNVYLGNIEFKCHSLGYGSWIPLFTKWKQLSMSPLQLPGSVPGPVPTRNRTVAMGFHTKPAPQKSTFLDSIKYLSSDRITTWKIRRLCSLVAPSPPAFRFAIRQVFVESRSKTRQFRLNSAFISQPLNEYQSDRKFESGRWKSD